MSRVAWDYDVCMGTVAGTCMTECWHHNETDTYVIPWAGHLAGDSPTLRINPLCSFMSFPHAHKNVRILHIKWHLLSEFNQNWNVLTNICWTLQFSGCYMWTNRQLQMCLKIQVCSLNCFGRLSTVLSSESSGMYCLMMTEAARIPETSVNIQLRTWQYIPGDSELHTRCRENLKSHIINSIVLIFQM
jgi:hypothetical protein